MHRISRYARLFVLQIRMSAVSAMQYRADFMLKGAIAFIWLAVALIP